MTEQNLQEFSNSLETQMYQQTMGQVSKDMGKVFNALCVENDPVLGRIPERIFRDYFLPYFAGERSMEDTNIVAQWISVAGTPSAEVRVIDDVTQEELYRVPPIMSTQFLDVQTRPNGQSMKEVLEQAALYRRNIPAQGERFLEMAYGDKAQVMLRNARLPEEYNRRWGEIMVRYRKQTSPIQGTVGHVPDSSIDYDEEV
ncbi:MAG: hypothetical protein ACR2HF_08960 [Methylococcaceae bacterium]